MRSCGVLCVTCVVWSVIRVIKLESCVSRLSLTRPILVKRALRARARASVEAGQPEPL